MQDLKPIRVFLEVAKQQSFAAAASITVARFFEGVPALLRLDEPFATSTKR